LCSGTFGFFFLKPVKKDGKEASMDDPKGRQSLFNSQFPFLNLARFQQSIPWASIKTRFIITITLPVVLLMALAGYITYTISQEFISSALERSTRLQVMAVKHEIESFLEQRRQTLLFLSKQEISPYTVAEFLAQMRATQGVDYRSIFFLGDGNTPQLLTCAKGDRIAVLPPEAARQMNPNPLLFMETLTALKPGAVWISPIMEAELPCNGHDGEGLPRIADTLIFMGIRNRSGSLLLSFNAKALRNILSVFNSNQSPLYAFRRTPETRFSYLFDIDGWILFQSGNPDKPAETLDTATVRSGFKGTLGRPGLAGAFRPASAYGRFWKMVGAVREGRFDAVRLTGEDQDAFEKDYFLAYAPVRFAPGGEAPPLIYAGVGYLDVSRLTTAAGYKHLDAMFIIILVSAAVVVATIIILGHLLTRPILHLADQVRRLDLADRLEPISMVSRGVEVVALRDAINQMIATVNRQVEEIRQRDLTIHHVSRRVAIPPEQMARPLLDEELARVPGLVGVGMKIDKLRSEVLKAARVDVDVLIQGETGTGKQVAAEGIHLLSARAARSFIAINCGALDEHLLLDTLFGHIRGAFTEARADRKGAFLQASGGTLFLDEIQSASPKVQQALLRAVAMRCIRPLGSDGEVEVNVRLIAASNVDLRQLIEKGRFREDLFFRLMVIPIHTPPLREMPENIPLLANYFLQQHRGKTGRRELALSKGALEKLLAYRWPGNIRELQHCILRAVVMSEASVIQADDLILEEGGDHAFLPPDGRLSDWFAPPPVSEKDQGPETGGDREEPGPPQGQAAPRTHSRLNLRQQRAWPLIVKQGSVRRTEYHQWCGETVSTRTAVYDLQDLVEKGHLKRIGRGRCARYVPAGAPGAGESE
jgi:DNA-binding NtrC family response regulator